MQETAEINAIVSHRRLPNPEGNPMQRIASSARLISTQEAADLLDVSTRTITNWINEDKVPYIKLPGGGYRLPLAALLQSLSGNYDLLPHIQETDEATQNVEPRDELAELEDPADEDAQDAEVVIEKASGTRASSA